MFPTKDADTPAPLPGTFLSGRRQPSKGIVIQGSGPLVRHLVS